MMQSAFTVVARRRVYWERMDADDRASAPRTDWNEPPQYAGHMFF
jgi:hypothetical protein